MLIYQKNTSVFTLTNVFFKLFFWTCKKSCRIPRIWLFEIFLKLNWKIICFYQLVNPFNCTYLVDIIHPDAETPAPRDPNVAYLENLAPYLKIITNNLNDYYQGSHFAHCYYYMTKASKNAFFIQCMINELTPKAKMEINAWMRWSYEQILQQIEEEMEIDMWSFSKKS